jgi:hypothetical protein
MPDSALRTAEAAPEPIQAPGPAPSGLSALAELSPDAPLTAADLGRLLGRNPRTIQRAADRGDFPPPFTVLGRHAWTAGAILAHLARKQAEAVALDARRERRRMEARP